MPFCTKCGAEIPEGTRFCTGCGAQIGASTAVSGFIVVTTPTVPGYRVTRILGIVSGLTARTRGVGGKFVASIQSIVGGEVSAFTSEIEKARVEAIQRMTDNAASIGANAVIGMDIETSDLLNIAVISATGTAVLIEPE